jgi:hypothetical protein
MQLLIIFSALFQLAIGAPTDATGASNSPGVLSGNVVQAPINLPLNVCGNSVNVVGVANPTSGNECTNTSTGV